MIVEREVPGICHRIFIANGKLLYAVKRLPKPIVGNGKDTIKGLIAKANKKDKSLPPWLRTELFPMDDEAIQVLKKSGVTLDSVLDPEQQAHLREIESTQWGGFNEDVKGIIHPDNVKTGIMAAKLFGLSVAGIDVISDDISKPWYENGAIINEVNFSPLLGGRDISRQAVPVYLKEFIENEGRIPIITLQNRKSAETIQKSKYQKNIHCYIIDKNQVIEPDGKKLVMQVRNFNHCLKALLLNPGVDEIIVVSKPVVKQGRKTTNLVGR